MYTIREQLVHCFFELTTFYFSTIVCALFLFGWLLETEKTSFISFCVAFQNGLLFIRYVPQRGTPRGCVNIIDSDHRLIWDRCWLAYISFVEDFPFNWLPRLYSHDNAVVWFTLHSYFCNTVFVLSTENHPRKPPILYFPQAEMTRKYF